VEAEMALSDDLTKLAARTREAEERAAAAQAKTKGALEKDVADARSDVEAQAELLRRANDENHEKISARWSDVQNSWHRQIASIREEFEARKGEHDLHKVQKRADRAEDEAAFAVDFAYSAIVAAEYAVLDAALARLEADELSETQTAGGS
jgi:hypothetical protein